MILEFFLERIKGMGIGVIKLLKILRMRT